MKKFLWLAILFFQITLTLQAQSPERPKKEVPLISEVVSELKKATGWMLQNNGEWTSEHNQIPFKDYKLNKINRGKYGLGQENFTNIEVRQAVVDNTVYSILIIKYKTGRYKFPVLEQDWEKFEALKFYVFNENRWNLVWPDTIAFNKPYAVNMKLLCSGTIEEYNEKTYLFEIENSIQKAIYLKETSLTNLIFAGYPVNLDDDRYMRFKFYESINKREIYIKYLLPYNWDKLFRNYYYEVDFEDFDEFVENIGVTDPQMMVMPEYYLEFEESGIRAFQKEDFNTALVKFTKAALMSPADSLNADILMWKARTMIELKQYEEAIHELDRVVVAKSGTAGNRDILAEAFFLKGNAKYALHDYLPACESWQRAVEYGYEAAQEHLKKRCGKQLEASGITLDAQGSNKLFEKGLKDYNRGKYLDALLAFEDALAQNPVSNDFRIHYYIGLSRFGLKDYVRSIDDFEEAIVIARKSKITDSESFSDAYVVRGKSWYEIGNTQLACADWIVADSLGNADAELLLEDYCGLPDPSETFSSDDVQQFFRQGIDLYKQGQYEASIRTFNEVLELNPGFDNLLLYTYRASAHHKTGNYKKAVEDFTTAILMEPESQEHYLEWVRAYFNRGVSKYFIDDRSGACRDWNKSIELGLEDMTARSYINKYCSE